MDVFRYQSYWPEDGCIGPRLCHPQANMTGLEPVTGHIWTSPFHDSFINCFQFLVLRLIKISFGVLFVLVSCFTMRLIADLVKYSFV